MNLQQTPRLEMAARFINNTGSHVFLTGKAGTGKTTFLRQLAKKTHKRFLVVAPTGIAALNAGGVTIHSQFLLPFGSFVPEYEAPGVFSERIAFHTRKALSRMHPLNMVRKKVLRATDLLIIDEVSMLRADILDAIDYRLRRAKGLQNRSFGGTQLLMIGDLHQLPPIVKEEEWQVLQRYYTSMHFFGARAFRHEKMVYIELDRIFRQQDDGFIQVLNRLRDNRATTTDIDLLNEHYQATAPPGKDPIIITTHNRTADGINSGKLDALAVPSSYFEAEITGDFPEKLYPLPERIELKAGTQLMFIRNDSDEEKAYVNGSLARVLRIEGEQVTVEMQDGGKEYVLKKEVWEHKKYILNEQENEVVEEVIGTFGQYPVKPAWAVTVHKSQGLTFDSAVIDVGRAFAPGQVYVALSRLRSLDGLILRTRILPSSIMSDREVNAFTESMDRQESLSQMLEERQRLYLEQLLSGTFEFSALLQHLDHLRKSQAEKMEFEDQEMREAVAGLFERFRSEENNTAVFREQLTELLQRGDRQFLMERLKKGCTYYTDFMFGNLKDLLFHMAEVEQLTRTKTYLNAMGEIEQQLVIALERMERVEYLVERVLSGKFIEKDGAGRKVCLDRRWELKAQALKAAEEHPKFKSVKSGRKRKKGAKLARGESAKKTCALVKEGKSLADIADLRDLAPSTILGHVVKGIRAGDVDIFHLMEKERVEEISALIQRADGSIKEVHHLYEGRYSRGELRMVDAYLKKY